MTKSIYLVYLGYKEDYSHDYDELAAIFQDKQKMQDFVIEGNKLLDACYKIPDTDKEAKDKAKKELIDKKVLPDYYSEWYMDVHKPESILRFEEWETMD